MEKKFKAEYRTRIFDKVVRGIMLYRADMKVWDKQVKLKKNPFEIYI